MPDVFDGERLEVVLLEEIVRAKAKQLKGNTNVTVKVEPVQHAHTRTNEEEKQSKYLA